jgi:hypothetical protein
MARGITSDYPELTDVGVEQWMEEAAKKHEPLYTEIFDDGKTSRLWEDESSYAPIGLLDEVAEAAASPVANIQLGYNWRYEQKIFKQKIPLGEIMQKVDQYNILTDEKHAKELATSAALSRDVRAFSMFRRAFDSDKTYGDGESMISTSHPRKDGGAAQSNTFADGIQREMTYENAILLEDQMYKTKSNSGVPLMVGTGNVLLMVPTKLRHKAMQIADTDDGIPGETDHGVNYWYAKGSEFSVLVNPYLDHQWAYMEGETTSTDAATYNKRWFLMDMAYARNMLKFKYLMDFEAKAWEDKDTDVMWSKIIDSFSVGLSGWFGIYGSKGDGSDLS